MKLNKTYTIVGVGLVIFLLGSIVGVVHNHNVQAEKTAQEVKVEYDNLIKDAKTATEKAESFKSEADVKTAQDAIKKLEEKDKPVFIVRVETVRQNWDWVNAVDKSVVCAEKSKTDATVKTAQTEIDKLKEEMPRSQKIALQKRLDKVKTDIKIKKDKKRAEKAEESKKASDTEKPADNSSKTAPSNSSEADQEQNETPAAALPIPATQEAASDANAYFTPETPVGGGNSGNGNTSTPNPPSTGGGNTVTPPTGGGSGNGGGNAGNGGGTTTPPPVTTYTGWVRRNGIIVWTQGGFSTLQEAGRAATIWMNENADFDGDYSSGAY